MKIHREHCVYFKHTLISIAQFAGGGRAMGKITEKKKAGKERLKRTF